MKNNLENIEKNKKILSILGAYDTKPRYQKALINSADKRKFVNVIKLNNKFLKIFKMF